MRPTNIVRIPKKGSNVLLLVLFLVLLGGVIGIGFYASQDKSEEKGAIGGPEQTTETAKKEKTKKEETKKEEKKEAEKITKTEYKVTEYSGTNFSLSYPASWQMKKVDETAVNFSESGAKGEDDLTVNYKENLSNLPIERFYDGINDINLFEDAAGGFEKTTVDGNEAFRFKNIIGEVSATAVVVKSDKGFVEIWDNASRHQKDGIFEETVKSIEVK